MLQMVCFLLDFKYELDSHAQSPRTPYDTLKNSHEERWKLNERGFFPIIC